MCPRYYFLYFLSCTYSFKGFLRKEPVNMLCLTLIGWTHSLGVGLWVRCYMDVHLIGLPPQLSKAKTFSWLKVQFQGASSVKPSLSSHVGMTVPSPGLHWLPTVGTTPSYWPVWLLMCPVHPFRTKRVAWEGVLLASESLGPDLANAHSMTGLLTSWPRTPLFGQHIASCVLQIRVLAV